MDSSQIIQDLNRKFAAPLPEFYKRRIVVWYDEDREFEDQIDGLALLNAKILRLTGSNNFYAKKLLAVDDPTSNYLVYCPLSYDTEEIIGCLTWSFTAKNSARIRSPSGWMRCRYRRRRLCGKLSNSTGSSSRRRGAGIRLLHKAPCLPNRHNCRWRS